MEAATLPTLPTLSTRDLYELLLAIEDEYYGARRAGACACVIARLDVRRRAAFDAWAAHLTWQ